FYKHQILTLILHDALPIYADKAGRSNSSINNLKKYEINHYVIDLFPERKDGFDLADAIIAGLRPEIKEPQKVEKKTREDFEELLDRKSTRLNSSHVKISYA